MNIGFERTKYEELVNDHEKLEDWCRKKTGATSDELLLTLNALQAAPSLYDVPHTFHPHPLKGKYKGCFGIWVNKTERIIFRPDPVQDPPAIIYKYQTIKAILVVELCTDYHGH